MDYCYTLGKLTEHLITLQVLFLRIFGYKYIYQVDWFTENLWFPFVFGTIRSVAYFKVKYWKCKEYYICA